MAWARRGPRQWITVYADDAHATSSWPAFFDTAMHDPDAPEPRTGRRWSTQLRESATFVARHPRGYEGGRGPRYLAGL